MAEGLGLKQYIDAFWTWIRDLGNDFTNNFDIEESNLPTKPTNEEFGDLIDSMVDTGESGTNFLVSAHNLGESLVNFFSPYHLNVVLVAILALVFGVLLLKKVFHASIKHIMLFVLVLTVLTVAMIIIGPIEFPNNQSNLPTLNFYKLLDQENPLARSHAKTLVWYATFTKILPLLLSIGVFFTSSSWVRNFLPEFINEVSLFYGITFFYAGLIFVAVEAPFALPEAGKSNAGKFGAVLLVGLGIGSFIFAGLTFFGVYNPTQDDGTLNTVLSILLLIMMSMFVFQAREEIFHHRRLNISAKLKGIMG